MYKKYIQDNDYSEYIEDNTVYTCRKDIKCENGFFESGSLVMLQVCNSDLEKINVIDFKSVCMRVKNNPFECDYVNQIKIDNLWDSAVIPINMISEYFEKADEVNQSLKNVKKAEKKASIITFILSVAILVLLFLVLIFFFNASVRTGTFMIVLAAFDVSVFIIIVNKVKKVHNKFCNTIIYGSDSHENKNNVSP